MAKRDKGGKQTQDDGSRVQPRSPTSRATRWSSG